MKSSSKENLQCEEKHTHIRNHVSTPTLSDYTRSVSPLGMALVIIFTHTCTQEDVIFVLCNGNVSPQLG